MSEYHVVEVVFKDQDILVESLKDMGLSPEIHAEGTLVGNNYRGISKKKAHVVVKRSSFGGMGDIGFEKTDKGFVMHADDYDHGSHGHRFDLKKLNKTYVEKKLRKYLSLNSSYNIYSRKENENGQVEIQIRVN